MMKTKLGKNIGSGACLLLLANPLLAEGFGDSNLSPLRVSPAQNAQKTEMVFDSEAGIDSKNAQIKSKDGSGKVETNSNIYSITVGGSVKVKDLPLQVGVHATKVSSDQETSYADDGSLDTKGDVDGYVLTPRVSFDVLPQLSVGYRADIYQYKVDIPSDQDGLVDDEFRYTTHTLGALYHVKDWEAGMTLKPQVGEKSKPNKPQAASEIAVHGRYRISPEVNVGAVIKQYQNKRLSDEKKDTLSPSIVIEYAPASDVELDAMYTYKPSTSKDAAVVDTESSSTHEFYVGADYLIRERMKVGAFYNHLMQRDDKNDTELDANGSRLGIRASYHF